MRAMKGRIGDGTRSATAAILILIGIAIGGCSASVHESPPPISAPDARLDSQPVARPTATSDTRESISTLKVDSVPSLLSDTPERPEPFESQSTIAIPDGLISHGSRDKPEIALTFDACEIDSAEYDAGVINALVQARAPATLFLGGKWMLDHPTQTRALAQVPFFELANHSYNHPHFAHLSAYQVRTQVVETQDILYQLTGRRGTLFRFPYGESTAASIAEIHALGLRAIQWDDQAGDPDPQVTAPVEIAGVVSHAQNGSIVVMHMNGRGLHTAEALPKIIAQLRARGFTLVTVSQLLADGQAASQ